MIEQTYLKNTGYPDNGTGIFALYIHLLKIICPSGLYRHQNIIYPPVLYLYQNTNFRLIKMFAYNMQKGCIISNFTMRPINHNHQLIKFSKKITHISINNGYKCTK